LSKRVDFVFILDLTPIKIKEIDHAPAHQGGTDISQSILWLFFAVNKIFPAVG